MLKFEIDPLIIKDFMAQNVIFCLPELKDTVKVIPAVRKLLHCLNTDATFNE